MAKLELLERYKAVFTHEDSGDTGHLYYFAPLGAKQSFSTKEVKAIIDVAQDGTLVGVELIYDMPPPPKMSVLQPKMPK